MELYQLTAKDIHVGLRRKDFSAREVAQAHLYRVDDIDHELKAFITVTPEKALLAADKVDALIARGEVIHKLSGVPIAIKDNICTQGIPTTCGSRMLEHFVPPYSATAVKRLCDLGVVIVGKTNLDEFAMGSSTENSAFGVTKNPHCMSRVAGGSSGGSAAAVASGQAVLALGSDTGGSIRQPAAFCGVVGLKTTYGLVSRFGLIAFASSLDHIGPLARTVSDAAWALQAITGLDPRDSTSVAPNIDSSQPLAAGVKGKIIGIPKEYFGPGVDKDVAEQVKRAIKVFEGLGAETVDISLPHTDYSLPAYHLIATAEASSNLSRYDGVRYGFRASGAESTDELIKLSRSQGFGAEVKRRIMLGTYALSKGHHDAYYSKAQKVRTLIRADFTKAFSQVDIIVTPTTPTTAFTIGSKIEDPLAMYRADIYTVSANLAGIPAVSLNCGFVDGLPVGLQLMGPALSEILLLQAAFAYEQETRFAGYQEG